MPTITSTAVAKGRSCPDHLLPVQTHFTPTPLKSQQMTEAIACRRPEKGEVTTRASDETGLQKQHFQRQRGTLHKDKDMFKSS